MVCDKDFRRPAHIKQQIGVMQYASDQRRHGAIAPLESHRLHIHHYRTPMLLTHIELDAWSWAMRTCLLTRASP